MFRQHFMFGTEHYMIWQTLLLRNQILLLLEQNIKGDMSNSNKNTTNNLWFRLTTQIWSRTNYSGERFKGVKGRKKGKSTNERSSYHMFQLYQSSFEYPKYMFHYQDQMASSNFLTIYEILPNTHLAWIKVISRNRQNGWKHYTAVWSPFEIERFVLAELSLEHVFYILTSTLITIHCK